MMIENGGQEQQPLRKMSVIPSRSHTYTYFDVGSFDALGVSTVLALDLGVMTSSEAILSKIASSTGKPLIQMRKCKSLSAMSPCTFRKKTTTFSPSLSNACPWTSPCVHLLSVSHQDVPYHCSLPY